MNKKKQLILVLTVIIWAVLLSKFLVWSPKEIEIREIEKAESLRDSLEKEHNFDYYIPAEGENIKG